MTVCHDIYQDILVHTSIYMFSLVHGQKCDLFTFYCRASAGLDDTCMEGNCIDVQSSEIYGAARKLGVKVHDWV